MGNHRSDRGDLKGALASFQTASKLRPDAVPPLVNASMAHAKLGQTAEAEAALMRALSISPGSAAANFNLGLLMAGKGDMAKTERYLRAALKADPNMAEAAYNLSIVLSKDRMPEALRWSRKAVGLRPDSAKYAYMLALLLHRSGNDDGAIQLLTRMVEARTAHADAYRLLGMIYEKARNIDSARAVYRRALSNDRLPPQARSAFRTRLQELERRQ